MDDLPNDTASVSVALGVVEGAELGGVLFGGSCQLLIRFSRRVIFGYVVERTFLRRVFAAVTFR